jgi:hypothetical protein
MRSWIWCDSLLGWFALLDSHDGYKMSSSPNHAAVVRITDCSSKSPLLCLHRRGKVWTRTFHVRATRGEDEFRRAGAVGILKAILQVMLQRAEPAGSRLLP